MIRGKKLAAQNFLLDRLGMAAGFLFNTFIIGQFFYFGIIADPIVVTNGRRFGFGQADKELRRVADPGFAPPVNISQKQRAAAERQKQQHNI